MIRARRLFTIGMGSAVALCLVAQAVSAFPAGKLDVELTGSARAAYDDNITFSRQNTKSDTVTSVTVGAGIVHEGKAARFLMGANLSRNLYANYDQFDNWATDLNVQFGQDISRYDRIELANTFTRSEEPASFEDAFGVTSGRYTTRRNRVELSYRRQYSMRGTLTGRYGNEYTAYSRDDLASSVLHRTGLENSWSVDSSLSLQCGYDFYWRHFNPGRDASVHRFTAGFKKNISPRTAVTAAGGVDYISAYSGREYTKISWDTTVISDVDPNTGISLGVTRRYETNASTQDIFGYWQCSAGLRRRFLERLGGSVSLFFGRGSYETLFITDTFQGLQLGAGYDLKRNVQAVFGFRHSRTLSNAESREYRRNLYTAAVAVNL